LLDC